CRKRRPRLQGVVVRGGISKRLLTVYTGRLGGSQYAQNARAFTILAGVGLMFQLKRHVLVAHGAEQDAVGGAALLHEHVVAHHALAAHGNPEIWNLCSVQTSPSKSSRRDYTLKKCVPRAPQPKVPMTRPPDKWAG